MNKPRILFADDDSQFLDIRSSFLKGDFRVECVTSESKARERLTNGWYHLAILDDRLIDDKNPGDHSGTRLASDPSLANIRKIILTKYDHGWRFPEITVLRKQDPPTEMVDAVKEIVFNEIRINWGLEIRPRDRDTRLEHILGLISDNQVLLTADVIEEFEDLFRTVFFKRDSVTIERVVWQRDGRVAAMVTAAKKEVGPELFLITVGQRAIMRAEAKAIVDYAPKALMQLATFQISFDETTHFGASLFAFSGKKTDAIGYLPDLYRGREPTVFQKGLATLFERTLEPWRKGHNSKGGGTSEALYRERLAGALGRQTPAELQSRLEELVEEGWSLNHTLQLTGEHLTVKAGEKTYRYENPARLMFELPRAGEAARVHCTPGTLTGKNILCEGVDSVWVTDFLDAGTVPPFWEFTSIEAMVRYDWLDLSDLEAIHELEHGFTSPYHFVPLVGNHRLEQATKCEGMVRHIRKAALRSSEGDMAAYHWGMFYQAAHRLASYEHRATPGRSELARFIHVLLSVGSIGTLLERLQSGNIPPRGLTILPNQNAVDVDGEVVELEPRHYKILVVLAGARGQICTFTDIVEKGMEERFEGSHEQNNRLFKDISELRGKIGEERIAKVQERGYRLAVPAPV